MTARAECNCWSAIPQINPNSSSGPHFTHRSRLQRLLGCIPPSPSPPAGQLCAAATSLPAAWGGRARKVGAHSSSRHQNPCTLPAQLWLRAKRWTHRPPPPPLRCMCAGSGSFSLFFFKGQPCLFLFFCFFQRRCFLAPASSTPPPPESGGTLSVAQRDSAVSDYRPCAEEPPAQSASLWGRNRTQDSGGTRAKEESVLREEFFPFLFFPFSSPSSAF